MACLKRRVPAKVCVGKAYDPDWEDMQRSIRKMSSGLDSASSFADLCVVSQKVLQIHMRCFRGIS